MPFQDTKLLVENFNSVNDISPKSFIKGLNI